MNATPPGPKPSLSEFFSLPEVCALRTVQHLNAYGTPIHRAAFARLKELATERGVETVHFGEYYEGIDRSSTPVPPDSAPKLQP